MRTPIIHCRRGGPIARDGFGSCGTGQRACPGFTLVEMLVAIAVLLLILVIINQLFNSAMAVTGIRNKQMDADSQTRTVFDRMEIDFAQMVKRSDVDYFLKSSAADTYGNAQLQPGNDQLAFYSQVPGYYPAGSLTAQQSPMSLVAFRVGTSGSSSPAELQRYGLGLLWNGAATSGTTMVFSSGTGGGTTAAGINNAICSNWPAATDSTADSNYELAGPQVFRMEYYYVLAGQTVAGTYYPSILSDVPWDRRIPNHKSVCGLQDVAAIGVAIAVLDRKSRVLVDNSQLTQLAATMQDFPSTDSSGNNPTKAGDLESKWQSTINTTSLVPHAAAEAIRLYGRTFYLPLN